MIKYQTYKLNKILLTNKVLELYINKFWNDVYTNIINKSKDDKYLMILCKIKYSDDKGGYKTIGPLRNVNYKDKDLFIEYLTERLGLLIDSYEPLNVSDLIFTYIIKNGKVIESDRSFLQVKNNEDLPFLLNHSIKLIYLFLWIQKIMEIL